MEDLIREFEQTTERLGRKFTAYELRQKRLVYQELALAFLGLACLFAYKLGQVL